MEIQSCLNSLEKRFNVMEIKDNIEHEENIFLEMNKMLYERDRYGDTLFHVATIQNNISAVDTCLDYLLDASVLNIKNNDGMTPLILAVLTEQKYLVRRFVMYGADLDIYDNNFYTALHYCAEKGLADCALMIVHPICMDEIQEVVYDVKAFKAHKGLLTRKTINGFTCLDLAIQNRQFNMIMFLCVYLKSDVNTAEHLQGNTPLHCAVINEDFVMVQFLVHEFRVKRSRLDLNKIRYDYHTA